MGQKANALKKGKKKQDKIYVWNCWLTFSYSGCIMFLS
jgi:hypothetical protein